MDFENTHTDGDCMLLLQKIMKGYPAFLKTLLPQGWAKSDFVTFFHPTAQQQFDEYKRMCDNINRLSKKNEEEKEVLITEYSQDLRDVDEDKEPLTLLGLCLWDIFSDNHTVIDSNGMEYNLGSFRGSAGFIAELINGKEDKDDNDVFNFDYMEFHMGTSWIEKRSNVQPFYEFIFSELKNEGCNWEYYFPKISLINFLQDKPESPEEYDPNKALEQEFKNKEVKEFQEKLDKIYEEEFEEAKYKLPPKTVLAYRKVYGYLPDGHPQKYL